MKPQIESPQFDSLPLHILFAMCMGLLAAVFFLWPGQYIFPAGVFSATSYFLAQALLPECRFRRANALAPVNWLSIIFFMQLVVMPMTVRGFGIKSLFLPTSPSMLVTNFVTVLMTAAYWSYALGLQWNMWRLCRRRTIEKMNVPGNAAAIPWSLIVTYALLGLAGICLKYKSISNFFDFMTTPAVFSMATTDEPTDSSFAKILADFLWTFLGFATVMAWSNITEKEQRTGRSTALLSILVILCIPFTFSLSGSYNRGAYVFPLVAFIGTAILRAPRQAKRALLPLVLILVTMVAGSFIYRFSANADYLTSGPTAAALENVDMVDFFQLYGQAPQHAAYMIEQSGWGVPPALGKFTVVSAAAILPAFGKPFREIGGNKAFAKLIGRTDMNPAFLAEVYLDFNLPGVLCVFALFGCIVAWLQRRAIEGVGFYDTFIYHMIGVYLIAIPMLSVEVLMQFLVYSLFPVYVYLFIRRIFARRTPVLLANASGNLAQEASGNNS